MRRTNVHLALAGVACCMAASGCSRALPSLGVRGDDRTLDACGGAHTREKELPVSVLHAAGLPSNLRIDGHHQVPRTIHVRKIAWTKLFRTQRGVVCVVGHPVTYDLARGKEYVAGSGRLIVEGAAVIRGHGPLTVWKCGELLNFSPTQEPWILVDVGGERSPFLLLITECRGAGGPLIVEVAESSASGTLEEAHRLGFVCLDPAGQGRTYMVRPSHRGPRPEFEVFRLEGGAWRKLGASRFCGSTDAYSFRSVEQADWPDRQ